MKVRTEHRKTIEKSKIVCLQVREKKVKVIESIHKFIEIIDAERLLKKLPEDIKTAKEVTEESQKGFTEFQPQLEEQTKYNDNLKKEVNEKGEKLSSLLSEVGGLKAKIEKYEEKECNLKDLKNKLDQLEVEKDSTDLRVKGLEPDIQSLKNETSSIQSNLEADEEEINRMEPEKQRLTLAEDELSERIKNLGELEVKKSELAGIVGGNNEINKKTSELKNDLDNINQRKEKTTADTDTINDEVEGISSEVDNLKNRAESLNQSVIPKDEVDKLQAELNKVSKERDDFTEKIAQIEKEIEEHMESKGAIIKEVEDSKAELESISNEYNSFKEEIDLYEKNPDQLERLKNKISDMRKTGEEYAKKAETEQEQIKHLNNALDILNTEMHGYKEALEQINSLLININ